MQCERHGEDREFVIEQLCGNRKQDGVSKWEGLFGKIARLGLVKPRMARKPFLSMRDSAFLQLQSNVKENTAPSRLFQAVLFPRGHRDSHFQTRHAGPRPDSLVAKDWVCLERT